MQNTDSLLLPRSRIANSEANPPIIIITAKIAIFLNLIIFSISLFHRFFASGQSALKARRSDCPYCNKKHFCRSIFSLGIYFRPASPLLDWRWARPAGRRLIKFSKARVFSASGKPEFWYCDEDKRIFYLNKAKRRSLSPARL